MFTSLTQDPFIERYVIPPKQMNENERRVEWLYLVLLELMKCVLS